MNLIRKRKFAAPIPGAYTIELRQRIERLEYLRVDACMRRERDAVTLIDKQIKHTIVEWIDSFIDEGEVRLRKVG